MNQLTRKSWWGKGVATFYISFVVFILACVGFASMQNYDLVEADYYDKGVAYQGEIDKATRTEKLQAKPAVIYNKSSKGISLLFPTALTRQALAGTLYLMRPSDATMDTTIALQVDDSGVQTIDASALAKGLWRATLEWTSVGVDYSIDALIVVE